MLSPEWNSHQACTCHQQGWLTHLLPHQSLNGMKKYRHGEYDMMDDKYIRGGREEVSVDRPRPQGSLRPSSRSMSSRGNAAHVIFLRRILGFPTFQQTIVETQSTPMAWVDRVPLTRAPVHTISWVEGPTSANNPSPGCPSPPRSPQR